MIRNPKVGDRVSYEDTANPRREGTIRDQKGTEFRVDWDDAEPFSYSWSDLRQAGWKRVSPPALGTAIRRVERLMETAKFSEVTQEALEVVLAAAKGKAASGNADPLQERANAIYAADRAEDTNLGRE